MGCASSTSMADAAPGVGGGVVTVCWVSGLEETFPMAPCDTAESLKKAVASRHKIPVTKLKLLHDAGVVQNSASASELDGQTITVVATSVHVHSANAVPEKRFGRRTLLQYQYEHFIGQRVKSKISFESPEGISVFEGSIGIVTGPGHVGYDDVTVDFPDVPNVGMLIEQIECTHEQNDEKDSQASTNTGVTSTATANLS